MAHPIDPKREPILKGAQIQFSRYGFGRMSMADIAKEIGVSRASLYTYFENKEEIFRELSIALNEESLGAAEQILKEDPGTRSLANRVEAALLAKIGRMHELVSESPHGGEIIDENNRLCGEIMAESALRFQMMLASEFKEGVRNGEVNLKRVGLTPSSAAETVHLAASGLKQGAEDSKIFRSRLKRLVRVFFEGLV